MHDRASQQRDVLRPRHPEASGEDEERHARDADRLRLSDLVPDRLDIRALLEQACDALRLEAAFGGDVEERGAVADVAPSMK